MPTYAEMTAHADRTEAAKALDPANLPRGTFVRWFTERGWGRGTQTEVGSITRVTANYYVVESFLGMTKARIPRTEEGRVARGLVAVRTAAEQQVLVDATMAENKVREAERKAAVEREKVSREMEKIERRAAKLLIERHRGEFEDIVGALIAEEDGTGAEALNAWDEAGAAYLADHPKSTEPEPF